jgi:hypothetical protein
VRALLLLLCGLFLNESREKGIFFVAALFLFAPFKTTFDRVAWLPRMKAPLTVLFTPLRLVAGRSVVPFECRERAP